MKFVALVSLFASAVFAAGPLPLSLGTVPGITVPNLTGVTCPAQPSGIRISPSLMVPVSKNLPNTKFGSTNTPITTPGDFCTVFNLELDQRAVGKTCNLIFDLPNHSQTHSPYLYMGGGHFSFTGYAIRVGATVATTYKNQPAPGPNPSTPPPVMQPGNSYVINSAPCSVPAGIPPVTVSGMLCSPDTDFIFYQSASTCPIGFMLYSPSMYEAIKCNI
jgi:Ubiquitin 3 binding protein But2 C-terminal domain